MNIGTYSMWRVFVAAAMIASSFIGCRDEETPPPPPPVPEAAAQPAVTTIGGGTATAERDVAAASPEDVTGAYFAMTELPGDFSEIDHLSLATIDENGAPAPLNGFLRPKASRAADYVLAQPRMDGRRLTFTTAEVDGVRYAFDGAFEVAGNFPENPPDYDTAVLAGTLTKIHKGQNVATTPVRFRYEAGG